MTARDSSQKPFPTIAMLSIHIHCVHISNHGYVPHFKYPTEPHLQTQTTQNHGSNLEIMQNITTVERQTNPKPTSKHNPENPKPTYLVDD